MAATPATPQVALHHAQTVQVMCTKKHLLTGLFVIFKIAPLPEGAQTLHDHVRGTEKAKPVPPVPPTPPEEPHEPTEVDKPTPPKKPKASAPAAQQAAFKQQSDDYAVGKAAYDAYAKLKAQYDKDLKTYEEKAKAYKAEGAKHAKDLVEYETWTHLDPPDPADGFVLGFVDHFGFLQPVHDDSNPWFDMGSLKLVDKKWVEIDRRNPHTYKLAIGEKFLVCGVRHPSPDLARALTTYLNASGSKDDPRYGFAQLAGKPKDWKSFCREVTVEKEGEQPVLKLSETAADFYPLGSSEYGEWLLYRDMPHKDCGAVPDQVKKLMIQLGKMRYPCGRTDKPYRQRKGPNPKGTVSWDDAPDDLVFDGQVQACVARLQEHVLAGEAPPAAKGERTGPASFAFQVAEDAYDKGEWSYLLGSPVLVRDTVIPREGDKLRPLMDLRTKGLVDVSMGFVIKHWLQERLRKPGHVMLPTSTIKDGAFVEYYTYLLEQGALSVEAWDGVVRVFGCDYGAKGGSSVRSVNDGVWPGAINNSVHKTGLALDMAGGATRHATEGWPIRYEAHWEPDQKELQELGKTRDAERKKFARKKELDAKVANGKKLKAAEQAELTTLGEVAARELALKTAQGDFDKRVADDGKDGKFLWIQRWRVYGHSKLDVFEHLDDDALTLKKDLADFLGLVAPTAEDPHPHPVRGLFWKRLKDVHFAGVSEDVCGHWLDFALAPIVEKLSALVLLSPTDLRDAFFRNEVVQFTPNAYEGDGGTAGKRYKPKASDGDFPAAKFDAKSWVNISALAQWVGMLRIGPHSDAYRDQGFVRGPGDPKAAPRYFPFNPYFKITNADEGDVATMLHDISASQADAPQLKQREFEIVVMRGKEEVMKMKPAAVDGEFVKGWADALGPTARSGRPPVTSPGGAALAFVLSASGDGVAKLGAAADKIGSFGGKSFLVTHVGDQAGLAIPAGSVLAGSDLKTKLKKAIDDFPLKKATAEAAARRQQEEDEKKAQKDVEDEEKKRLAAGKKATKPSDLATKIKAKKADVAAKAKEAARAASKKEVPDWTVELTPIFLSASHLPKDAAGKVVPGKIPFLSEDRVLLPVHSDAGHLEWWHFQHVSASEEWGSLLERSGYSREVMGIPTAGVNDRADPIHRGLGYTKKELESHPGVASNALVENSDAFTPSGG